MRDRRKDRGYQRQDAPKVAWDVTPDDVLLERMGNGDLKAGKIFCGRYINAVFRRIRLYYGDHAMAAECAEEVMADFLLDVMEGHRDLTAFDLLDRAVERAKHAVVFRPGAGLSERQRKALKLLEPLPSEKRLLVECHLLDHVPVDVLRRWLSVNSKKILTVCKEMNQYESGEEEYPIAPASKRYVPQGKRSAETPAENKSRRSGQRRPPRKQSFGKHSRFDSRRRPRGER